jgi:hypothetical protein
MLMLKMVEDNMKVVIAKTNFELLCDVSLLLALACLLPLLETTHMHSLNSKKKMMSLFAIMW